MYFKGKIHLFTFFCLTGCVIFFFFDYNFKHGQKLDGLYI